MDKFEWGTPFNDTLIVLAAIVGTVVLVSGIGLLVMWIKYSWIKRENSLNFTGRDLTQKLFNENGVTAEIKSSFFYAKFWNHNKRNNTYRLRQWTHDRRSIWTMMEASQQAYATIIRDAKPKEFWLAFRLPRIVGFFGILLGAALVYWGMKDLGGLDNLSKASSDEIAKLFLGLGVVLVTMTYMTVWRAYSLRKNVPVMLANSGLNEYELNAIKKIFTWALVYAIAQAILQTIRLIMQTASRSQNGNKN